MIEELKHRIIRRFNLNLSRLELPSSARPFPWREAVFVMVFDYPMMTFAVAGAGVATLVCAALTVIYWR